MEFRKMDVPNRIGKDKPVIVMIVDFSTEENTGAANNDDTKGDWRTIQYQVCYNNTRYPCGKAMLASDTEGRTSNGGVQFCYWGVDSSPESF